MSHHTHSDIFSLLEQDHERISQMLEKVGDSMGLPEKRRAELFSELQRTLRVHMWAEQESVYSFLAHNRETHPSYESSLQEHEMIEKVLAEVAEMPFSSPLWEEKIEELTIDVEYHLSMEEGDLFERIRQTTAPDTQQEMARLFIEHRNKMERLPHRAA